MPTLTGIEPAARGGTQMGIVSWLVVGAIAGWLAGFLVKGDESLGVIGHIVLGIVGGLIGGFLAGCSPVATTSPGSTSTTIIVAVIGAVIVVVGYNLRGRVAGR